MAQNQMVNKGMTQVFTGLGILLGAGRICNDTHEKIIGLINADQQFLSPIQNRKADTLKETPAEVQSQDLLGLDGEFSEMTIADKISVQHTTSTSSTPLDANSSSNETKIICPWWSTPGYTCRKNQCILHHEDVADGLKEPLICHFWANGDRCTKTGAVCRFAHYHAKHHEIAPMPTKKKGKNVINSPTDEGQNNYFTKTLHDARGRENDEEFWRKLVHSRPGEEWWDH
ncbi:hypothetical protein F4804DRAFT_348069 [Jackrogersella minutella]|nr:hypothetical protein F4804DRAFT_348069 [Jackrogersella minutella]